MKPVHAWNDGCVVRKRSETNRACIFVGAVPLAGFDCTEWAADSGHKVLVEPGVVDRDYGQEIADLARWKRSVKGEARPVSLC